MSAVTKSTDPRYAGRTYTDDPEVYAARIAYAQALIAEGKTFKSAWYHAFLRFPRTYHDTPATPTGDADPRLFVYPTGVHGIPRIDESTES